MILFHNMYFIWTFWRQLYYVTNIFECLSISINTLWCIHLWNMCCLHEHSQSGQRWLARWRIKIDTLVCAGKFKDPQHNLINCLLSAMDWVFEREVFVSFLLSIVHFLHTHTHTLSLVTLLWLASELCSPGHWLHRKHPLWVHGWVGGGNQDFGGVFLRAMKSQKWSKWVDFWDTGSIFRPD